MGKNVQRVQKARNLRRVAGVIDKMKIPQPQLPRLVTIGMPPSHNHKVPLRDLDPGKSLQRYRTEDVITGPLVKARDNGLRGNPERSSQIIR